MSVPMPPQGKRPAPAEGNPTPEDKFVYIGPCARTGRDMTICYQTFGSSSDPCLLLVSGLASTLYVYRDAYCEQLAASGFYVVRYDNRDIGLSTHLDGLPTPQLPRMILPAWLSFGEGVPPYTLREMALDGLGLLTAIGVEQAHILGQSMGGMIVQCMSILQPERILSMTIVYSHSGGPNVKPQSFGMSLSFLDGPKSDAREDVVAYKVRNANLFVGGYSIDEAELTALCNKVLDRRADDKSGVLRQIWAIQRSPSRDEDLRGLKGVPTLIIHGPLDTTIPLENGVQLSQLIADSKLVVFPRMGHYVPPELYDDIISELCLLREKSKAGGQATAKSA